MANQSPPAARRAAVFYDHKERKWSTVILEGQLSSIDRFNTEAEARSHVGLEGGSQDMTFIPAYPDTAYEMVTS